MKTSAIMILMLLLNISSAFAQADWVWSENAGGSGEDSGRSIVTDAGGNSYVTGSFSNDATFGSTVLSSNGYRDIFVAKMDATGNWLWAIGVGGSSYDGGYGICIDNDGNAYVTGNFKYTVSFGDYELSSNGNRDVFVAKISSEGKEDVEIPCFVLENGML